MAVGLVVLLYAVWSSVFSIGKIALDCSSPLFLIATRMILGGAILFGSVLLFQRSSLRISWRQFLTLCFIALFSNYLTNAFEYWGLQHLSAAKACFLYSLSTLFSVLFSYIHFGEKMNLRKWLGLGISFLGFLPILSVQSGSEELTGSLGFFSWAELSFLAAVLVSSYGWVLLRLLVKKSDSSVSPLMATSTSMLLGGVMALIHSLCIEPWNPIPIATGGTTPFIQSLFLLTLISNVICQNAYGYMLRRFTATFLSFVGLLSPIFASINGWILLNEPPNPIIFLGTGVIMLGLWLVYSAELRQGYIIKQPQAVKLTA